ncbi:hypothetical protein PINS_up010338 [Pythium insidiosum]|nr:hypothetical protein PINS_up010338 [Pythium insidiosum]
MDPMGRLQLYFAASCLAFDVSFTKAQGISITCVDAASSLAKISWTTATKDYVVLNIPIGTRITMLESDDQVLGRL